MIDALKRKLGITPEPAKADTSQESETMTIEDNKPSADTVELLASVESLTSQLAESQASLSTVLGQVAALTASLEAATAWKAEQEKLAADAATKAAEAKTALRTSQLASVLGDEKAAAMNTSLASLDDVAFDSVLASLGYASKTEATSPLFSEVGVDGDVDATKLVEGNRVMDYLTSKYKAK